MSSRPAPTKKRRSGWIIAAALIIPLVIGGILARWSPVAIALVLVVAAGIGLFVLIARPLPAIGFRTRTSGLLALGLAALLATGGGIASASSSQPEVAANVAPRALVAETKPSTSPRPTVKPTTFDTATEEVTIPFEQTTVDDSGRDQGTTALVTAGVAGLKVITYRITLVDGVETAREVADEVVQTAPIAEVTAIGTRAPAPVAPPAPDPPAAPAAPVPLVQQGGGDCHPSYTGACVPFASDVDCDGGGGDGPAYVRGPVNVVSPDEYKLDRDGDGLACDK